MSKSFSQLRFISLYYRASATVIKTAIIFQIRLREWMNAEVLMELFAWNLNESLRLLLPQKF